MNLIINEENLNSSEIDEFSNKVRALLIDKERRILIANYGEVILLPGGSIDDNESMIEALRRELSEELGQTYSSDELTYLITLEFFQKNYPKRNGTTKNRLVKTYYFVGEYKGISKQTQVLTEKEQKDKFRLELISEEELQDVIASNSTTNPRNKYFQQELLTILKYFTDNYESYKTTKLKTKKIGTK